MAISQNVSWPGWETVRKIGTGGFGAVYEIQRDIFGRTEKAALKVISIPENSEEIEELYNDGYDDQSITLHFQSHLEDLVREYSLMLDMKGHTNVVYCDDLRYVQHDDGIGWDIYIKMELLTPLTKVVTKEYSEQQTIRLGMDLCNALILCKQANIVHRDIKPQNIFVSRSGDYKLGDFGIAKISDKTASGTKIGTYEYMSPEVYHGQSYGSSADIYSLGLVLFWMMNEKRTPFLPLPPEIPTASAKETARLRRFRGEKLPVPRHGSEELQRIILKACAYDPKNRYISAEEMREDLRALEGKDKSVVGGIDTAHGGPVDTELPVIEDDVTQLVADSDLTEQYSEEETQLLEEKKISPEFAEPELDGENTMLIADESGEETVLLEDSRASTKRESENVPIKQVHEDKHPGEKPVKKKSALWIGICVAILAIALIMIPLFGSDNNDDEQNTIQNQQQTTPTEKPAIVQTEATETETTELPVVLKAPIKDIAVYDYTHIMALREDGTVDVLVNVTSDVGQDDVDLWTDIIQVAGGVNHTLGLRSDGTVVSTEIDHDVKNQGLIEDYGQTDVSGWTDIVAIAAGRDFSIGLKADGTVVAVGNNNRGQCDVEHLRDVVAISASEYSSEFLLKDGTWIRYGYQAWKTKIPDLVDIVSSTNNFSLGLKSDGTVVGVFDDFRDEIDDAPQTIVTMPWSNVRSIDSQDSYFVIAFDDGTVKADWAMNSMTNAIEYENGIYFNNYGELDVSEWENVVKVCCGYGFTVGLKADGTLITAGCFGSSGIICDVAEMNNQESNYKEPEIEFVREEVTFTAPYALTAYMGNVDPDNITWKSDDPSVATISRGTIWAKGSGETTVYGEYNGIVISCTVKCNF